MGDKWGEAGRRFFVGITAVGRGWLRLVLGTKVRKVGGK